MLLPCPPWSPFSQGPCWCGTCTSLASAPRRRSSARACCTASKATGTPTSSQARSSPRGSFHSRRFLSSASRCRGPWLACCCVNPVGKCRIRSEEDKEGEKAHKRRKKDTGRADRRQI